MKRLAPWQQKTQRTAKALRELPRCATPECNGTALGVLMGSDLCPRCQQKVRNQAVAQRSGT
jgi:hypothetical protein